MLADYAVKALLIRAASSYPGGVQMGPALAAGLVKAGMSVFVLEALKQAMLHAGCDSTAQVYANAMPKAFEDYGLRGVNTQVAYMLLYLRRWASPEAKAAKAVLRKWTNKDSDK